MGKKILLTLAITLLLVLSLFSFFQVVKLAKAVPTIPPDTVWHIEQPKNASYDTNYVAINFTVETNLGLLYYYSLDGQEKQEIGTKTISTVPLPDYKEIQKNANADIKACLVCVLSCLRQ